MLAPRRKIAVLAAAIVWGGTPAQAATVSVATKTDPESKIEEIAEQQVVFEAQSGERNAARISFGETTVAVSDSGAPLTPGEGCRASSGGVTCDVQELRGHRSSSATGTTA